MLAVILIGGQGTRLRPLTCGASKPLLPLLNRPFLLYQFDLLKMHGVRDAVLCASEKSRDLDRVLLKGRRMGLRLRVCRENRPLGTGGALKNALKFSPARDPVLVLNGDILHALDIRAFSRFYRARRAEAAIALTRVKDPSAYGLVVADASGRVRQFLEKPSWDEAKTDAVNAGAYLIDPSLIGLIPDGRCSLERDFFPRLLSGGRRFFSRVTLGYWMDIGTPEKYLQAHLDLMDGRAGGRQSLVVMGPGSRAENGARFFGRVCLGANCRVGKDAVLEDCVILDGTIIGDGASLKRCVIGPRCRIEARARVENISALAADSRIKAYSLL
ncbi:MAG: sugar phosphate nucleotidyltransferase [Elusimicrobiota bacterium]